MISHRVTLDYALHPGWMARFVEGLQTGQAMARQCTACGVRSFPPQRVCACGATEADWVALPGTATIQFRTSGSDGDFALVRFDGADTSAVVRVRDLAADQTRGRCQKAEGALPMMILGPMDAGTP
jgi:uncharacterized OB-fold protein